MTIQTQFSHLAQVARRFRHGPGRTRRSKRVRRVIIHVQVNRVRLGTHEDHEHAAVKIGLLRALHLACPDADILVDDLSAGSDQDGAAVVATYDASATMRNRAVSVVQRSIEQGTWRAFAERIGDESAPWILAAAIEPSEVQAGGRHAERNRANTAGYRGRRDHTMSVNDVAA